MSADAIKIGLLGLGTVGQGLVNVLARNQDEITRRAGRPIEVVGACVRDINKPRHCELNNITLTDSPWEMIENQDIDIIVELMGGESLAQECVFSALDNQKHIVTANKAMIARHGNSIFTHAQHAGLVVSYEAAVAGGIPIIKALREGLAANRIDKIIGILNGTSNYILTKMQQEHIDFSQALEQAQAAGFAEADPSADIDGIDCAHKLTILSSLAFGIPLAFDDIHIEGITHISLQDIQYAEQLGYIIKHVGMAKRTGDGLELRAHPALIPISHTLAHVNGEMNAILVHADALGESLYYGAGAGAEPTASAVIADLIDVVRGINTAPHHRVPHLSYHATSIQSLPLVAPEAVTCANYIRICACNQPGVLAKITTILSECQISIESIIQKEWEDSGGLVPIVIITHRVQEIQMHSALERLQAYGDISGDIIRIRLALTQ